MKPFCFVAWLLFMLEIFYCASRYLLVHAPHGEPGSQELTLGVASALLSLIPSFVMVTKSTFTNRAKLSAGIVLATMPALVIVLAGLVLPWTFSLGRDHFCSAQMLERVSSPVLQCNCDPTQCGG